MTKTVISISNVIKLSAFAMAVILSLTIVIMCCVKLSGHLNEGDKALYVSLLTSIVSIWLPSPSSVMNIKTKDLTTTKRVKDEEIGDTEEDVKGE